MMWCGGCQDNLTWMKLQFSIFSYIILKLFDYSARFSTFKRVFNHTLNIELRSEVFTRLSTQERAIKKIWCDYVSWIFLSWMHACKFLPSFLIGNVQKSRLLVKVQWRKKIRLNIRCMRKVLIHLLMLLDVDFRWMKWKS